MIYDEPRFSPGGDRYVLIEFGNEMNLELNFMAQGLASAIEQNRTKGVIETAPCFASMLVHYDPDAIGYGDLRKEMTALIAALGPSEDIELDSRALVVESRQRSRKQVRARNPRRSERERPDLRFGASGERAPRIGLARRNA